MKKLFKYMLAVALAFTAAGAFAGYGANQDVFVTAGDRLIQTFQNARSIIFIVGGFGLIGLGFAAIFGKVNWKWLAALACGLAIVAVAGQVVDYATRNGSGSAIDRSGVELVDTMGTHAPGL